MKQVTPHNHKVKKALRRGDLPRVAYMLYDWSRRMELCARNDNPDQEKLLCHNLAIHIKKS